MKRYRVYWQCEVSGWTDVFAETEKEAWDKWYDMPIDYLLNGNHTSWVDDSWESDKSPYAGDWGEEVEDGE